MEDLCTLSKFNADDLSIHAVSFAVLACALRDAHAGVLKRSALHRAADLALEIYEEEYRRDRSVDCQAPLLDEVYCKAFVAADDPGEELAPRREAIAGRFHSEVLRLLGR